MQPVLHERGRRHEKPMHHNWRKPACSNEEPLYQNGQESACSAGDPDSIPGSRNPLEKEMATHSSTPAWEIPPMAEGAWQATVHIVTKSWAWLSDFTFTLSNKQTETKSKDALFLIFGKLTLSMEEKNHHSPPLWPQLPERALVLFTHFPCLQDEVRHPG